LDCLYWQTQYQFTNNQFSCYSPYIPIENRRDDNIYFKLIVKVSREYYFSCKIDRDCYIYYFKSFTPSISSISPQNFYAGSEIQFRFLTNNLTKNLLSEIKIGKNICMPTFDRFFSYQSKNGVYFNCFIGDAKPEIIADFMLNHFTGFPTVYKRFYKGYINSKCFDFTDNFNAETNLNDYLVNIFDNKSNIKKLFSKTDTHLYDYYRKENTHSFKIFPLISSLSTSGVSPLGKSIIIVKGKGFFPSKELTEVFIDTAENKCIIKSINSEEIICETEKLSENLIGKIIKFTNVKESDVYKKPEFEKLNYIIFPGSPGLSYKFYSPFNHKDMHFTQPSNYDSKLIKSDIYLETSSKYNQDDNYSQYFSGYFKAPISTEYKFYVSSDDHSYVFLWINGIRTKIIDFNSWVIPDDFISNPNLYSKWITLVGGNVYYFELIHHEFGGIDHMTLGVEIKNPKYLNITSRLLFNRKDKIMFDKLKKTNKGKFLIDFYA